MNSLIGKHFHKGVCIEMMQDLKHSLKGVHIEMCASVLWREKSTQK